MTRTVMVAVSFVVLALVLIGMVLASETPPVEVGPFTTGDGDTVVIAPRSAP